MRSQLALITFLDAPYPDNTLPQPQPKPPWAGGPGGPGSGYPDNSLPPFPSHPIVVPPGGWWPAPPYPSTGPGFPTNPIQLPPWAGGWQPRPDNTLPPSGPGTTPPTQPPPTGPVFPVPPAVGVPIELVAVFVPGVGFVIIPKSALPPEGEKPPVDPNAPVINPL